MNGIKTYKKNTVQLAIIKYQQVNFSVKVLKNVVQTGYL